MTHPDKRGDAFEGLGGLPAGGPKVVRLFLLLLFATQAALQENGVLPQLHGSESQTEASQSGCGISPGAGYLRR